MLRVVEKRLNKTLVVLLCAIYYSCCTTQPLDGAALVFCWLCYMNLLDIWFGTYRAESFIATSHPYAFRLWVWLWSSEVRILRPSYRSISYVLSPSFENGLASQYITFIREHVCTFSFSLGVCWVSANDYNSWGLPPASNIFKLAWHWLTGVRERKKYSTLRFWFGSIHLCESELAPVLWEYQDSPGHMENWSHGLICWAMDLGDACGKILHFVKGFPVRGPWCRSECFRELLRRFWRTFCCLTM